MRFMTLYKPGAESTAPPTQHVIAQMGQFIQELGTSGVLTATDGLQHSSRARASGSRTASSP